MIALLLAAALVGAQAFEYDASEPLDLKENSVKRQTGMSVYSISYSSPGPGRVSGYLVVPDGTPPFPGILFQHGLGENHATYLESAANLAWMGAVVLMIDAPFAREANVDRQAGSFTFTPKDRDEQIQHVVDLRRGIDLLVSRPDVDASRLGYLGRDHGATIGGALAGVDKRIKAYVLAAPDGGLVAVATNSERGRPFRKLSDERRTLWLDAMEPIDPVKLVASAAPASLFFQAARYDEVVSKRDALRFYEAASEPKQITWYDAGHDLNVAALRDHVDWLAAQLGLDGQRFWRRPREK